MAGDKIALKKQWFITSNQADITTLYNFDKELGQGAYGKVMLATHIASNQRRAIKAIPKYRVKDYATFKTEIDVLRDLDHPNIVKMIETFETDRMCYVVLEYCEGGELFKRIVEQKHLTEDDAALIVKQIISAVMYCHDHNICHRDLKPENCLMDTLAQDSGIKLIDFGLSHKLSEDELMHSVNGTPYYIAPEVLAGAYSYPIDMWSIGVMTYIMLSGTPPFNGKNNAQILYQVQVGYFAFRPRAFQYISEEAKDFISKLLVKDPELRLTAQQAFQHPWIQRQVQNAPRIMPDNVISGIENFVQSQELKKATLTYIASKLSHSDIEMIKKQFVAMDVNGDGLLSPDELQRGLNSAGHDFDLGTIGEIAEMLDTNLNGMIDYNEFIAACMQSGLYLNTGYLRSAFEHFDVDKSGKISADELRQVLGGEEMTLSLSSQQIDKIIQEVDVDQDGQVDYEEFLNMMQQLDN